MMPKRYCWVNDQYYCLYLIKNRQFLHCTRKSVRPLRHHMKRKSASPNRHRSLWCTGVHIMSTGISSVSRTTNSGLPVTVQRLRCFYVTSTKFRETYSPQTLSQTWERRKQKIPQINISISTQKAYNGHPIAVGKQHQGMDASSHRKTRNRDLDSSTPTI